MNDDYQGDPSKPLRIGLIGVGGIARSSHLPALEILRNRGWPITVVAVADPAAENVRHAARFLSSCGALDSKCQNFEDGAQLLAAGGIDAALILTTPAATPPLIQAALERGTPALVEKPVAYEVQTLERLVLAESRANASLVRIAYNRRSQPLAVPFQERLSDFRRRALNGAVHVEARLWRSERTDKIFYQDTMVHALDFLLWSVGPLEMVRAQWRPPLRPGGLASSLRAEFKTTDGPDSPLTAALDVRPAIGCDVETYEAFGPGETLKLVYPAASPIIDPARLIQCARGLETTEFAISEATGDAQGLIGRGFLPQLAAFLHLVASQGADAGDAGGGLCTLAQALATLRLRQEIFSRADSG